MHSTHFKAFSSFRRSCTRLFRNLFVLLLLKLSSQSIAAVLIPPVGVYVTHIYSSALSTQHKIAMILVGACLGIAQALSIWHLVVVYK